MVLRIFISILSIVFISGCNPYVDKSETEEDLWRLRWRMQASIEFDKDIKLAKKQFDILYSKTKDIEALKMGINLLGKKELKNKIDDIICTQSDSIKSELCYYRVYPIKIKCCDSMMKKDEFEEIVNIPKLRDTIILMYIKDQVSRGENKTQLADKYGLEIPIINRNVVHDVDGENVRKLKSIIEKYGFPSRYMVGIDAMEGVWTIIQHANNPWWQEEMLPYIEDLVQNGELSKSNLAYLKDRILTNLNKEQIYGTQVKEFDKYKDIFILKPTQDSINVDKRRMEVGLPPIEYYKRLYFN
ncbi:MAG TPA: hypothetical protein PKD85_04450 [Saprospiraceae bacterium]|nr:hypothetical protein [Saprospiraceae bacterium]